MEFQQIGDTILATAKSDLYSNVELESKITSSIEHENEYLQWREYFQ